MAILQRGGKGSDCAIGSEDYYTAEAESRQPITGSVIESTDFPQSNEAQLSEMEDAKTIPEMVSRKVRSDLLRKPFY